ITGEDIGVETHMRRLALIVELLAQPVADLCIHFTRVDGAVHAPVDREDETELLQIRIDRGLHVRILKLYREPFARDRNGPMHLAEGSGGSGLFLETSKARFPAGSKFRPHPPLDERPAHGWCS